MARASLLSFLLLLASALCPSVSAAGSAGAGGTDHAEGSGDSLLDPGTGNPGFGREIPWHEAAWKTALLPAWNAFETGEMGLGYAQALADGKAGLGLSRTDMVMNIFTEPGGAEPASEAPQWDLVWRIEPMFTFGGALWDNKVSVEASLGFTAWDSRFAASRERDAIPFGWGSPVEPGFRFVYWL